MARPALSAARALDVLNFLAAHPDDAFTLSDLVRRLGVNVASMHAVLAVLEEREYVRRDAEKSYGLGPMAVPLGHAALRRNRAMATAIAEIDALSAEFGVTGLVVGAAGAEMVVMHEVAPPGVETRGIGQRIRMLPPIGGVFYAWADDAAIDAWIATAPKGVRTAEADLRRWLASIRERGYAVGLETSARKGLRRAVRDLGDEPGSRSARGRLRNNVAALGDIATVVIDPDPRDDYDVAHVAGPVRDGVEGVSLCLYLVGFRRSLSAYELERIGERLAGAARVVAAGAGTAGSAPGVAAAAGGEIW